MPPKFISCALVVAALMCCGPSSASDGDKPGSGTDTEGVSDSTDAPGTGTGEEHACQSWHSDLRITLDGYQLGSSGPGAPDGLETCTVDQSTASAGVLRLGLLCGDEDFVLEATSVPSFDFSWTGTEVEVLGRGQRWTSVRRSVDDALVLSVASNTPSLYPSEAHGIPKSETWFEPLALSPRRSSCGVVPDSPHSSGCFCGEPMFVDAANASGESGTWRGGDHGQLGDYHVVVGTAAYNACDDCFDPFPEQFTLLVAADSG